MICPRTGQSNNSNRLDNLSFSRFTAYFRVLKPLRLPPFTGSTFHGVLGHALRRVQYGRKPACPACPARSDCRYSNLYTYLFESPADHPFIWPAHQTLPPRQRREKYPPPLILEPPPGGDYAPGELLPLSFTLVGKAISCLPFIACALSIMATMRVGRDGGRMILQALDDGLPAADGQETLIYHGLTEQLVGPGQIIDADLIHQWAAENFSPESPVYQTRLRFLTPFRYKYTDKFGKSLTFEIFLRNLFRRLTMLSVHSPLTAGMFPYQELLAKAPQVKTIKSTLRWEDWQRYSARQKDRMKFGGFVGDIVFAGELQPFMPYLKLGEFLHLGKATSFGLGHYELSLIPVSA